MKLVDILARELKRWPGNISCMVQDSEGRVCTCCDGFPDPSYGDWTILGDISGHTPVEWVDTGSRKCEMAEDQSSAIVTRAEWQTAVFALNVGKPGDLLEFAEDYAATREECAKLEWNGEGLPPIGLSVVVYDPQGELVYGASESGEVIAHVENTAVVRMSYGLGCFIAKHLLTPEQIAAEARATAIESALSLMPGEVRCKAVVEKAIGIMIDAGYSK